MLQNPYSRGGQPFAHHTPISSNPNTKAPYHRLLLITMLFHTVGDFPDTNVKMQTEYLVKQQINFTSYFLKKLLRLLRFHQFFNVWS